MGPEFKCEAVPDFPVALGEALVLKSMHKMELMVTASPLQEERGLYKPVADVNVVNVYVQP